MVAFDRVLVSCDDNPAFYGYWPLVGQAWKKLFPEIEVQLIFVTNRKPEDSLICEYRRWGNVSILPELKCIPTANQGKLGRIYAASTFGKEVVMVNDIDMLPLQRAYYLDKLKYRKSGELLTIGSDYYVGTPHEGKFPMVYTTAEGDVWKRLVNPRGGSWGEWLGSLKTIRMADDIEDPFKPPNQFSDKSLLRALYMKRRAEEITIRRADVKPYITNIYSNTISRPHWHLDLEKLNRGEYIQSHMWRPLEGNKDKLKPMADYLGITEF